MQSSGLPVAVPSSFAWKRSVESAFPFGQDFVIVTFGAALSVLVIVQLSVSPKCASVPEQPALRVLS